MIPARLIRTVPEHTTAEVEGFWSKACDMHARWEHITYREPIDPAWFPLTGALFDRCQSGAQKAGLIRLELLLNGGGVYLDSDVEVYRPLDVLRHLPAFAGWEDTDTIPDAVLGAEPDHPAIRECLRMAIERIRSDNPDWRTGNTAWATGPGVTTAVLPGRDDVLVFPPGALYPYHWSERKRRHEDHAAANPWAFCVHHWNASWLPEEART